MRPLGSVSPASSCKSSRSCPGRGGRASSSTAVSPRLPSGSQRTGVPEIPVLLLCPPGVTAATVVLRFSCSPDVKVKMIPEILKVFAPSMDCFLPSASSSSSSSCHGSPHSARHRRITCGMGERAGLMALPGVRGSTTSSFVPNRSFVLSKEMLLAADPCEHPTSPHYNGTLIHARGDGVTRAAGSERAAGDAIRRGVPEMPEVQVKRSLPRLIFNQFSASLAESSMSSQCCVLVPR